MRRLSVFAMITCLFATQISAQVEKVIIPLDNTLPGLKLIKNHAAAGMVNLSFNGQIGSFFMPGCPDIPFKIVTFLLPQGARNISVRLSNATYNRVHGPVLLMPAQNPVPLNGEPAPAWQGIDSALYSSNEPYPKQAAEISNLSARGEFLQVSVNLFPARYFPASRQLDLLTGGDLVLEFENADHGAILAPARSVRSAAIWNDFASKSTVGKVPKQAAGAPAGGAIRLPGDQAFRGLIGRLPTGQFDYLIITSASLAPSFERLASWRAQTGYRVHLETVEWINSHSSGVDLAERVRNYIKAFWLYCGANYVLLGGDTEIIPARSFYYYDYYIPDSRVPSDLYYSDIVDTSFALGFWSYDCNANKNNRYGELPSNCGQDDRVDQTPDIFLGRAPVSDVDQAVSFVSKVLAYERNAPPGFAESVLLMADGNFAWFTEQADQILASNAPWISSHEMYNPVSSGYYVGDELLTTSSACDRLSQGYNIIYHFDHGGIYSLSMAKNHAAAGGGWIYRPQVISLQNAERPSIFLTPACSPNAFDYSAISKQMVNNSNGGVAAFIGNTRVGWSSQYGQFNRFFTALYGMNFRTLGMCFTEMVDAGDPYGRYALNLLGDPAMQVHVRDPLPLTVSHPCKISDCDSCLSVSVGPGCYGPAQAEVNLTQAGVLLASRCVDLPGTATFSRRELRDGILMVSVIAPDHIPFQDSCLVQYSSALSSLFTGFTISDEEAGNDGSSGNGDGVANPGETVAIYPDFNGNAIAMAVLTSDDPLISIVDSIVHSQSVNSTSQNEMRPIRFLARISPSLPTDSRVILDLAVQSMAGSDPVHFPITLDIAVDSLTVASALFRIDSLASQSRFTLTIDSLILHNCGQGAVRTAVAFLATDTLDCISSEKHGNTVAFGDIAPQSVSAPGKLSIVLPSIWPVTANVFLNIFDHYNRRTILALSPIKPGRPFSLSSFPLTGRSARLEWADTSANTSGYNVYRLKDGQTGRTKVNDIPVTSRAYILDGLEPLDVAYYAVSSIGTNGIESRLSDSVAVATAPAIRPGFPVQLGIGNTGTRIWGSPAAGDLNGDGKKELVIGSDDGLVYVLDDRGNSLPGWPKDLGSQCGHRVSIEGSSPALADLDGDGNLDIIMGNGPWWGGTGDNLVHAWRSDGTELNGWPQPIYGDAFGSTAVGDINNDGLPEVVATTSLGMVYCWDHAGQMLPGWPVTIGTRIWTGAAIGNMDSDSNLEVVVAANSSGYLRISVLDPDGTCLPGWPLDLQPGVNYALSSPALVDMDGNGSLEIVLGAEPDQNGRANVYCLNNGGTALAGWPLALASGTSILSSPAIGDLDDDGRPEIAIASGDGMIHSISHLNGPHVNWSQALPPNGRCSPVIGDLDGDGNNEIVVATEEGYLWALKGANGSTVCGFPIWIEPSWSAPLLTDLDADGRLNLVGFGWGGHRLYTWDLPSPDLPGAVVWGQLSCDLGRTGCYKGGFAKNDCSVVNVPSPDSEETALSYALEQCRPNPSRNNVSISYQLARSDRVEIKVYNLLGQSVRTLVSGIKPIGHHRVVWDRRDDTGRISASGTYFYRIVSGSFTDTKKAVIID